MRLLSLINRVNSTSRWVGWYTSLYMYITDDFVTVLQTLKLHVAVISVAISARSHVTSERERARAARLHCTDLRPIRLNAAPNDVEFY